MPRIEDLKICFVHNEYRSSLPSGENSSVLNDIRALSESGVKVSYLNFKSDIFISKNRLSKLLSLIFTLVSPWPPKAIRKEVQSGNSQIFHFHNTFPMIGTSAFRYLRRRNRLVVVTLHNARLDCLSASHFRSGKSCYKCSITGNYKYGIFYRCFKGNFAGSFYLSIYNRLMVSALKNVDHFVVLNSFSKKMLESVGVDRRSISVRIPIPPLAKIQTTVKENRIVFAGRLSEEKGLKLLLDAWRMCKEIRADWKLIIAGSGDLENLVREFIRIDQSIEFLGLVSQDRIDVELAKASAICVPSLGYEGFPTTIAHAPQFGVCAVVTDIGPLSDLNEPWVIKCEATSNGLANAFETVLLNDLRPFFLSSQLWHQENRFKSQEAKDLLDIYQKVGRG